MFKLQRIFKNYEKTGSFNEQVNLYGFVDSCVFLTKTGDLGVVLEVRGVDYECLDGNTLDGLTKRLESALKLLDETVILVYLATLFLNLFAAAFALNRKFFLKDTGRKLSHLDKQLHVGQTEVRAPSLEEEVD